MEKKTYIGKAKEYLSCMNERQIIKSFYDVLDIINEKEYEEVLKRLDKRSGFKYESVYEQRLSDEFINAKKQEITAFLHKIQSEELHLKFDEPVEYDRWEDNPDFVYSDPLGVMESFYEYIMFAQDCIYDFHYTDGIEILDSFMQIEIAALNDDYPIETLSFQDLFDYNLLGVSEDRYALLFLYAIFQENDNRIERLYSYLKKPFFANIHIEEIRDFGNEDLREEEKFWDEWIAMLIKQEDKFALKLLKESILYDREEELDDIAYSLLNSHPDLTYTALKLHDESYHYQKVYDDGMRAVKEMNKAYVVRSKIALLTAYSANQLGIKEGISELWFEAYVSDPSPTNYLRFFQDETLAKEYVKKLYDVKLVSKQSESFVDRYDFTYNNLRFLNGFFEETKDLNANTENSLGWRLTNIKTAIYCFLVTLYNGNEYSEAIKRIIINLMYNLDFNYNDQFTMCNKKDSLDIFMHVINVWKQFYPIDHKEEYIAWIKKLIDERTTAIVENKYRNHYGGVALLIVAFAELEESLGNISKKHLLVDYYATLYPRHRAFLNELSYLSK